MLSTAKVYDSKVNITLSATWNNNKIYPVQWECKGEETNLGGKYDL